MPAATLVAAEPYNKMSYCCSKTYVSGIQSGCRRRVVVMLSLHLLLRGGCSPSPHLRRAFHWAVMIAPYSRMTWKALQMYQGLDFMVNSVSAVFSKVETHIHNLIGFSVGQIRLIIHPLDWYMPLKPPLYLTYVQRFDIIPQATPGYPGPRAAIPDPVTGMYILKRAIRSNGSRMGDIIPLSRYRMPVELTPRFGAKADHRLTKENSLESSTEFILNKYFHKDTYHYLLCSHSTT